MQAFEMKCCLQRLQIATYLKHKPSYNSSYPYPIICHAIHKSHRALDKANSVTEIKSKQLTISLNYSKRDAVRMEVYYKTNTECLLRIL